MEKILVFSYIIGLFCFASAVETSAVDTLKEINVNVKAIPSVLSSILEENSATTLSPRITTTDVAPDNDKTTTTTTTTKTTTTSTTTTTPKTTQPPEPETTTTPKTTTTPETTTTPKTTTSTSTPSPTPIPPPTPAPKPKEPETLTWITDCIMIQMASQVNISYVTKDNKTTNIIYNIPKNASVYDYDCNSNGSQSIHMQWNSSLPGGVNSYSFIFMKNESTFYLYTIQLALDITDDIYPDENRTVSFVYQSGPKVFTFRTPVGMSYHCTRKTELDLTKALSDTESAGTLTISNVQIEAFHTGSSKKFSTAKDCDASDTPDAVPIAVGISLAALILVILITYLMARRRANARGYMSF